jgi:hypothetical protein
MMIRWVLLWLVCGTRTTCDGRPRGGDPLDNKQRRELRDRLNGDRVSDGPIVVISQEPVQYSCESYLKTAHNILFSI